MNGWQRVCALDEIAPQGSRVVATRQGDIAVIRDAGDRVFALHDKCPHRGGPLSLGIVHGETVTCPLHGWKLGLADGAAVAPDKGCARTFAVKVEAGAVWLRLD